jgi:hypothetical protein
MNTAIIPGSIGAIAKREGISLAESFVSADVVALVDVSGSMDAGDSRGGLSRYDVACEELANLQNTNPGKVAILAFSHETIFCPSGQPPRLFGSTNLAGALAFARVADTGDMRFVIISDGQPDDAEAAMSEARKYRGRIDVVYVGPEYSPTGRDFLSRLAAARGGVTVTADKAQQLAAQTQRLLLSA